VLRVPIPRCALHHDTRNHAQPPDDLSRFVEPPHVRVAGSEDAIADRKTRSPLERSKQVCRRLVEPKTKEVCLTDPIQIGGQPVTRAKPQIIPEMVEREFGLTGKDPEQPAPVPSASMARVEGQTAVDQADGDTDILVKVSESEGGKCQNVGIIGADAQRLSRQTDTLQPNCVHIFGPIHHLKRFGDMGRKRESRTVLRIPFDHLLEQVKCLRQLVSLVRQALRLSTQKQIIRGQIGGGTARERAVSAACRVGSITPATVEATLS
jgi:hypothetical protein